MREYELVHEIQNQCPNNQMRDIFFEEIACDDPETWLRQRLAGKSVALDVQQGSGGGCIIYALVDGMTEKFVFTPI